MAKTNTMGKKEFYHPARNPVKRINRPRRLKIAQRAPLPFLLFHF
jgi:hypothetical protein